MDQGLILIGELRPHKVCGQKKFFLIKKQTCGELAYWLTCKLESLEEKEREKKNKNNIWKHNDQIFSKFYEKYQLRSEGVYEYTKAGYILRKLHQGPHNQTTDSNWFWGKS